MLGYDRHHWVGFPSFVIQNIVNSAICMLGSPTLWTTLVVIGRTLGNTFIVRTQFQRVRSFVVASHDLEVTGFI